MSPRKRELIAHWIIVGALFTAVTLFVGVALFAQ
jgi:hypothetical protein